MTHMDQSPEIFIMLNLDMQYMHKRLLPIVIDGSNVAYCHGEDKKFTIRGLEIVVDDFIIRGSEKKKIVAFLPQKRDHFHPKLRETLKEKCSLSFAPRRHE